MKKIKCSICGKKEIDAVEHMACQICDPAAFTISAPNGDCYKPVCVSCQKELQRDFDLKFLEKEKQLVEMEKKYIPELEKVEKAYNKQKYIKYGPGTVVVITKDNCEYIGAMHCWKPEENYFSIVSGLVLIEINFENIKSAKEYGARISVNSPPEGEELDLMEKARNELKQGREKGWFGKDVPIMVWEENET